MAFHTPHAIRLMVVVKKLAQFPDLTPSDLA